MIEWWYSQLFLSLFSVSASNGLKSLSGDTQPLRELCSHWSSAIKLFILAQTLLLLSGRQTCARRWMLVGSSSRYGPQNNVLMASLTPQYHSVWIGSDKFFMECPMFCIPATCLLHDFDVSSAHLGHPQVTIHNQCKVKQVSWGFKALSLCIHPQLYQEHPFSMINDCVRSCWIMLYHFVPSVHVYSICPLTNLW